jgi:hypothetical protein
MRIVVEPSDYVLLNAGDAAMLESRDDSIER